MSEEHEDKHEYGIIVCPPPSPHHLAPLAHPRLGWDALLSFIATICNMQERARGCLQAQSLLLVRWLRVVVVAEESRHIHGTTENDDALHKL